MQAEDEEGHLSASFPATDVVLCEVDSSFSQDWHNAPCRRMVIVISGALEIELKDGSLTEVLPGQILLTEDLDGSGHKTRVSSTESLQVAIIPLA